MKKYIYTAVILVGFVLTTSCEDFLTTDNKSNVTDKEYFSTKTGFESLVSNAYVRVVSRETLLYEMFMQYPVILLILMQVRICTLMGVIISMMSCMNMKL